MQDIKNSRVMKSVHPLMFWENNKYFGEYNNMLYFIGGRGTSFLFKTDNNFYLITAKHNFSNKTTDKIVEEMSTCYIPSKYEEVNEKLSIDYFNKNNTLKLKYLPINISDEYTELHDLCIFHIFDNLPDSLNCLSYQFPDFSTEDKGYMIGFPQNLKKGIDNLIECKKAVVLLEIFGITKNDLLMVYKHNTDINELNGFSGSPVVQYNREKQEYILMGMAILAGKNTVSIIPASIINNVILEYEKQYLSNKTE